MKNSANVVTRVANTTVRALTARRPTKNNTTVSSPAWRNSRLLEVDRRELGHALGHVVDDVPEVLAHRERGAGVVQRNGRQVLLQDLLIDLRPLRELLVRRQARDPVDLGVQRLVLKLADTVAERNRVGLEQHREP